MPNPLYTYILNIWFRLIGFYCISTTEGYLMPTPFYTYILNIRGAYDKFPDFFSYGDFYW